MKHWRLLRGKPCPLPRLSQFPATHQQSLYRPKKSSIPRQTAPAVLSALHHAVLMRRGETTGTGEVEPGVTAEIVTILVVRVGTEMAGLDAAARTVMIVEIEAEIGMMLRIKTSQQGEIAESETTTGDVMFELTRTDEETIAGTEILGVAKIPGIGIHAVTVTDLKLPETTEEVIESAIRPAIVAIGVELHHRAAISRLQKKRNRKASSNVNSKPKPIWRHKQRPERKVSLYQDSTDQGRMLPSCGQIGVTIVGILLTLASEMPIRLGSALHCNRENVNFQPKLVETQSTVRDIRMQEASRGLQV